MKCNITVVIKGNYLEPLTYNLLPLTPVGSNPARDFGFLQCEEAIQL